MKLIRHILSHSILIGFVALMVLGFYYRISLFPASWNEQISQQVDRIAGPYVQNLHAFAAPVIENTTQTVAKAPLPEPVSEPAPAVKSEPVTDVAALPTDVPQLEESTDKETMEAKPAPETVVTKPVDDVPVAPPVEKEEPAAVVTEVAETKEVTASPVKKEKPAVAMTEVAETKEATASTVEKEEPAAAMPEVTETKEVTTVAVEKTAQTTLTGAELTAKKPETDTDTAELEQSNNKLVTTEKPAEPITSEPAHASTHVAEVTKDDEVSGKGSSDQDFVGVNDLWRQARTAFGQGDLATALKHYQALSEQEQDNPDVFGELGNVYYARGNLAEAGQAYYEAAVRLIELRQMGQIHYLVRVIEGLSPDNAAKLKQRLMR